MPRYIQYFKPGLIWGSLYLKKRWRPWWTPGCMSRGPENPRSSSRSTGPPQCPATGHITVLLFIMLTSIGFVVWGERGYKHIMYHRVWLVQNYFFQTYSVMLQGSVRVQCIIISARIHFHKINLTDFRWLKENQCGPFAGTPQLRILQVGGVALHSPLVQVSAPDPHTM